jgi:UDP-3-O-acyl-N-acetylglucosamine deacetylase
MIYQFIVASFTSLELGSSPPMCNDEHMKAILKCYQLIDLNIHVEATEIDNDDGETKEWIWKVI